MMNPLYDASILNADRIEYHDSIDSTNIRAKELAKNGAPHGFLVLADTQSAGRGRRGRSWLSRSGFGAWMSLILRPKDLPQERTPELVFPTAVALARVIEGSCIKWPNDIVLDGKKICGMLLEAGVSNGKTDYIVAGIGVNLCGTQFPEDIPYAGSIESVTGTAPNRARFVASFLREMDDCYALWQAKGMAGILPEYKKYSVTLQSMVRVLQQDGELIGKAVDILEDGALVVEDSAGKMHIVYAGDVSVRGLMDYV